MGSENVNIGYFLVTSHGRTATYWLASCLNSHPDITCTHGPVSPPILDYHDQPLDKNTKLIHETLNGFYEKSLDDIFEELEHAKQARVYGNVHGYSVNQLFNHRSFDRSYRKPVIANLVRHPIARIESLKRRLLYESEFNPSVRQMLESGFGSYVTPDVIKNIEHDLDVALNEMDVRAFVYAACFVPTNDLLDFQWPVNHIPMERLTKDVEYYIWLLNVITQNHVELSTDYINQTFYTKRKNQRAEERNSIQRFHLWKSWQQRVFEVIAEKFDLCEMYSSLGYDFGCILNGKKDFKYPLIYPVMPRMIEENYNKYNIIFYKNKYYGLSQKAGAIELTSMVEHQMDELISNRLCVTGKTESDVRCQIDMV